MIEPVQPVPTARIDLRSDTVTLPTPEMRQAMAEAVVGDDVYGEDATVNTLQQTVAELLGKEAALFMPSGSMTNQAAIAMHTSRGQEVICAEGSHIYEWELGMMAAFSGVVPRFVPAPLGIPDRSRCAGPFATAFTSRPPDSSVWKTPTTRWAAPSFRWT